MTAKPVRRTSSLAARHPAQPSAAPTTQADPEPEPIVVEQSNTDPAPHEAAVATEARRPSKSKPRSAPAPKAPAATRPVRDGVGPQSKVVHVAEHLANLWRARAVTDRVPLTTVAFRAIEDAYSDLGALFSAQPESSGLFESQARHRERPHLRREQITLRLTPANEARIDDLAAQHGVSRSDLVETAVARYLKVDLHTLEDR